MTKSNKSLSTLSMIDNTLKKRRQRLTRIEKKSLAEEFRVVGLEFTNPCRYCLKEIDEGKHFCNDDHFQRYLWSILK